MLNLMILNVNLQEQFNIRQVLVRVLVRVNICVPLHVPVDAHGQMLNLSNNTHVSIFIRYVCCLYLLNLYSIKG